MNALHTKALRAFVHRLEWLFLLRAGVYGATLWLFVWGVVILVVRISGVSGSPWLALGLLGILPVGIWAGGHAYRRVPPFVKLRASYDRLNACGGVVMSEEAADMSAWQGQLPGVVSPKCHWHGNRALMLLSVSALFAVTALLLPERLTRFSARRPLEIGQIADQLQKEVQLLHQEKIIEDKKAEDLQKQLSQIKADSSGYDPDKTWEALDHIQELNSDAARQAAEEALVKTAALSEAETLARAMEQAGGAGMNDVTASRAAQDLATMLTAAKLENGLLHVKIPPELWSKLDGLDKEQLQELLSALEFNKTSLGLTVSNLAQLKLIDPALLARCNKAGQCYNPNALAAYLSTCTNGCNSAKLALLCRGGPGGGGPEAPMTWSEGTSEKGLKFQDHVLPPGWQLSKAQLVGVIQSAPRLSGNAVAVEHGALANAPGSGGSAHAQVILPEQRQAVQNFFKRDEK